MLLTSNSSPISVDTHVTLPAVEKMKSKKVYLAPGFNDKKHLMDFMVEFQPTLVVFDRRSFSFYDDCLYLLMIMSMSKPCTLIITEFLEREFNTYGGISYLFYFFFSFT